MLLCLMLILLSVFLCFAENKATCYLNSFGDIGSDLQEETRALRHEDDSDESSQRREETHEDE